MNPLPLLSNDKELQYWYTAFGYPYDIRIYCVLVLVFACVRMFTNWDIWSLTLPGGRWELTLWQTSFTNARVPLL